MVLGRLARFLLMLILVGEEWAEVTLARLVLTVEVIVVLVLPHDDIPNLAHLDIAVFDRVLLTDSGL